MIGLDLGFTIAFGIGYLVVRSIPPMDPKLREPIGGPTDWEAIGIDPTDLEKRKEYIDQMMIKVRTDLYNRTKS